MDRCQPFWQTFFTMPPDPAITLMLWLNLTFNWSGALSASGGPVVWGTLTTYNAPTATYVTDTASIEPANITYNFEDETWAAESRLEMFLTLPPTR